MCEIYDSHTIFLSLCCSLRSTGAPALPTLPDAFTVIDAKIHQWAPGSFLFAMWDVDECSGWLVWRQHFYMGIFISGCFPPVTGSRHNKPGHGSHFNYCPAGLNCVVVRHQVIASRCVTFCANCQSWLHSQLYQLKASPKLPWIQGIWKCKWYEYPLVLKHGNGKPLQ